MGDLIICRVGAIPRRRLARCVESYDCADSYFSLEIIARGLRMFVADRKLICRIADSIADFLIGNCGEGEEVSLQFYRAIARSSV